MDNVTTILELLDAELRVSKFTDNEYIGYLDVVYKEYTGSSFNETYDMYSTPEGKRQGDTRPVAWYQTAYDIPGVHLVGPNNLSGFIPDRINSTIFSDEPIGKRVALLNYMFNQLEGLYEAV